MSSNIGFIRTRDLFKRLYPNERNPSELAKRAYNLAVMYDPIAATDLKTLGDSLRDINNAIGTRLMDDRVYSNALSGIAEDLGRQIDIYEMIVPKYSAFDNDIKRRYDRFMDLDTYKYVPDKKWYVNTLRKLILDFEKYVETSSTDELSVRDMINSATDRQPRQPRQSQQQQQQQQQQLSQPKSKEYPRLEYRGYMPDPRSILDADEEELRRFVYNIRPIAKKQQLITHVPPPPPPPPAPPLNLSAKPIPMSKKKIKEIKKQVESIDDTIKYINEITKYDTMVSQKKELTDRIKTSKPTYKKPPCGKLIKGYKQLYENTLDKKKLLVAIDNAIITTTAKLADTSAPTSSTNQRPSSAATSKPVATKIDTRPSSGPFVITTDALAESIARLRKR